MSEGFMKVLGFITVIAIIAGLYIHVFGTPGSGNTTTKEDSFQNVKEIEIDGNIFDLTIRDSDSDMVDVRYEGLEKMVPEFKFSNGKLHIVQPDKNFKVKSMKELNGKCELYISLPVGTKLDKFNCKTEIGDIEADSITAKEFDLHASLGKVQIRELTCEDVDIEANLGDVEIRNASFKEIDIDADLGDIKLDTIANVSDYKVKIKTSLGENKVDGNKVASEYESDGKEGKINIECDLGNVTINTIR